MGNNIFPAGNAIEYLAEYFDKEPINTNFRCGQIPYTTDLECVKEISKNPNGDVVVCSFPIGNINSKCILNILADYNPYKNPYSRTYFWRLTILEQPFSISIILVEGINHCRIQILNTSINMEG